MLTRKQLDLLQFIQERMQESGVPPSFEEMKDALDLKSKSGIHRLITALEERGFLRRLPNRARAIEVIRMPETLGRFPAPVSVPPTVAGEASTERPSSGEVRRFTPSVVEGGKGKASSPPSRPAVQVADAAGGAISIPVMGRIAAGTPMSAIQEQSHAITLSPDFLSSGEHYALEVRGDSMIEAGILDGDLVVIRRQDTADTGDIVVALIDDEEATLKRLRKRGSSIALEAANPAYETRVLGPDRVNIQGRLVSLVRRY